MTDLRAKYDVQAQPMHQYESFEASDVGYGPFVVRRQELIDEIIQKANPHHSVHISGCRGAGKTTLLHQIGGQLVSKGKKVYFFKNSNMFQRESVINFIEELEQCKEEAVVLVDETQNYVESEVFTTLLKNTSNHKITTIGAGVPAFKSASGNFTSLIKTNRLFITSDEMLQTEGIIDFFGRHAGMDAYHQVQITTLLQNIRAYVGGHIYPLMWMAEKLAPCITEQGKTAAQALELSHSTNFRSREEFKIMANRILPPDSFSLQSFRALLTTNPDAHSIRELQRNGFYDEHNKIISHLLFETFIDSITGEKFFPHRLNSGLDGVRQLLEFALPNLSWEQYNPYGGPIEDALSFELLLVLSRVSHLSTRLFNPKLIQAGFAGRKPDLYINTSVDAYVECVLTTANNESERKKLDEHISRFYWQGYTDRTRRTPPPYYPIGDSAFAILNFQTVGREPLDPFENAFRGQVFEERVFTFLMTTKEVFLGGTRIAGP